MPGMATSSSSPRPYVRTRVADASCRMVPYGRSRHDGRIDGIYCRLAASGVSGWGRFWSVVDVRKNPTAAGLGLDG